MWTNEHMRVLRQHGFKRAWRQKGDARMRRSRDAILQVKAP